MAKVNGQVVVAGVGGPYYEVEFVWIPRIGETIDLYSLTDQADDMEAKHYFKVVDVIHRMSDVTKKARTFAQGKHTVEVHVKKAKRPAQ